MISYGFHFICKHLLTDVLCVPYLNLQRYTNDRDVIVILNATPSFPGHLKPMDGLFVFVAYLIFLHSRTRDYVKTLGSWAEL